MEWKVKTETEYLLTILILLLFPLFKAFVLFVASMLKMGWIRPVQSGKFGRTQAINPEDKRFLHTPKISHSHYE